MRNCGIVASAALLLAGAAITPLSAQTAQSLPEAGQDVPQTGIIDPQAQKDADEIRSQTYRSRPVGKKQNWNLDMGHFKHDPSDEQDLRDRISDKDESYTGLRLNVPLGKKRR